MPDLVEPAVLSTPVASPTLPAAQAKSGTSRYADIGTMRRSAAFVVDVLLLSLLLFAVASVLALALGPVVRFSALGGQPITAAFGEGLRLVGVITSIIVGASYFVVSWVGWGATPSQRLLGMRVREATSGDRLTVTRALTRWIALGAPLWIASTLMPGLPGLAAVCGSVVWMVILIASTARSATGRGLHDVWARSVVQKPNTRHAD